MQAIQMVRYDLQTTATDLRANFDSKFVQNFSAGTLPSMRALLLRINRYFQRFFYLICLRKLTPPW